MRPSCRHRRIVAGATWLVTQKTADDRFWLVPSPLINAILLFLLVLKARRYGILVHAFGFMSNHFHLVVTDPEKTLPAFMRELLGESAKAIKLARRTNRKIWREGRYSAVHLLDLDAAEREIVYTLLNPTEAELTEPTEWPGLTSASLRFGDTITAERPGIYFSERRPESVSIPLSPLSLAFSELLGRDATAAETAEADAASESRIREQVESRTQEIRDDLSRRGRRFAGAERVKRMSCRKRSSHPVRNMNPRFATRDRELLEHAIAEYRRFEVDHERAKRRYCSGRHRVLFPEGTYGYRVVLGVRVARGRRAAA